MFTIWKYPLEIVHRQTINVPAGSEFLSVQIQNGSPCIWAKVNPREDVIIPAEIVTLGTGENVTVIESLKFLGTYQLRDEQFVGHVFVKL